MSWTRMQGITFLEMTDLIAKLPDLGFQPRNVKQVDFMDVDWDGMIYTYGLYDMSDDDKKEHLRKHVCQERFNQNYGLGLDCDDVERKYLDLVIFSRKPQRYNCACHE